MTVPSLLTIASNSEYIYEIQRSRFIARCFCVQTAEEADAHLAAIRVEHPFATHVCYAYSAMDGRLVKSSDDGEPKGTAGAPIADVLKKSGVVNALIAVIRYFGGVKLGAGGLLRAYSHAASEALALAGTTVRRLMQLATITLDFAAAARLRELECGIELGRSYSDSVTVEFATESIESLTAEISALLKQSATLTPIGERWL